MIVFVHAYILKNKFIKYSEEYSTVDKVGIETFLQRNPASCRIKRLLISYLISKQAWTMHGVLVAS